MSEDSFLLVNLKEDKAKKLAQVLSNESCRKILEFLTHNKSATETEISKKLGIPLSTVHYNLKHLNKTGLVTTDEFHYSKKGREVIHYSLANKYIVIAPKEDKNFMDKLKKFIPLSLISITGTAILYVYQNFQKMSTFTVGSADLHMEALNAEMRAVETSQPIVSEPNLALWFFFGTLLIILSMLILEFVKYRKNK